VPKLSLVPPEPAPAGLTIEVVEEFVRRYVVLGEAEVLLIALWIIHTWCFEQFAQTPYLAITSPVKRCGKSTLLKVLVQLSKAPWMIETPTEAVVFRYIELKCPTLLLDETDAIFKPNTSDRYEGLRALLNAGNEDGAKVPRMVGSSNKIAEFSTYCPKALAGINTLPDTIVDRSIQIRLERKTRDQPATKFRKLAVERDSRSLREKIEQWVERATLEAEPADVPDELNDRAQDCSEALVSIADAIGCGDRAREALIEVFSRERIDSSESAALVLLDDIRTVMARDQTISTKALLKRLHHHPESLWGSWYGRGLNDRDLAGMLKPFSVVSKNVRVGTEVVKSYKRDDLYPAWERYLL
jgi:hypothetical protein